VNVSYIPFSLSEKPALLYINLHGREGRKSIVGEKMEQPYHQQSIPAWRKQNTKIMAEERGYQLKYMERDQLEGESQ
jgi:hypothetical protein